MGRLAELAKAKALKGQVTLTNVGDGTSKTYPDEATAEAALPNGAKVEHRRGAFFWSGGGEMPKPKPKPKKEAAKEDA